MQIRSGIRWPVGVDFNQISTPGRISIGSRGKIMLLTKHGCANRPFYHVEVTRVRSNFVDIVEGDSQNLRLG